MTAADRLTSIPPMPPPPRAEGSSSSGLSIAIGGQFLAIVASVVVSAAFLVRTSGDGKIELKHGVGPIVWSLIPLWVVLLGSVLLNARRRTHNTDSYDLFSSGPDRIVGTADDKGNWESQ